MNKENKCALCSHRSYHNGSCLVDNQGCKFKPNAFSIIFTDELEKIKAEIKVNAHGEYDFEGYCREEKISIKEVNKIIDNYIAELKGE